MDNTVKIIGTNLGNWLVLEKWMKEDIFADTGAEDEMWLYRKCPREHLLERIKRHRDTYITEKDFIYISEIGMNTVRIPVPYYIFGDKPPLLGCIEYLDKAFEWANKYNIKILIDLHTVPGSQNGYDNGGIIGVCKFGQDKSDVKFTLSVLTRLAKRYGENPALWGIEVLNEPISFLVYLTAPSTRRAADKTEAKGSGYIPMHFLKAFYRAAYKNMRQYMPEDKAIVFHDGFRLGSWKSFFKKENMINVFLDTHIYITAMESFVPLKNTFVYKMYLNFLRISIGRIADTIPVIVGEWCMSNSYSNDYCGEDSTEVRKKRYLNVWELQNKLYSKTAGHFYWNYKLEDSIEAAEGTGWRESWDLRQCLNKGWIPPHK